MRPRVKSTYELLEILALEHALSKQAQNATEAARQTAISLAENLLKHQQSSEEQPDFDVFVRDLVDMNAFLNFLYTTKQRYNGKIIAFHKVTTDQENTNPEEYVEYDGFFIYIPGAIYFLRNLDGFAYRSETPQARTMRPLIKNLIGEFNKFSGVQFTSVKDTPGAQDNSIAGPNANGTGNDGKTRPSTDVAGDSSVPSVSPQKAQEQRAQLAEFFSKLSLPFDKEDMLSPFEMTKFAQNMYKAVNIPGNEAVLSKDNALYTSLANFSSTISELNNNWISLVSRVATAKDPRTNQLKAPHASTAQSQIRYVPGQRPNDGLVTVFGDTFEAKNAAQILLHMVTIVDQICGTVVADSPVFTDIIGKDRLHSQAAKAQAYINSLRPFATGS